MFWRKKTGSADSGKETPASLPDTIPMFYEVNLVYLVRSYSELSGPMAVLFGQMRNYGSALPGPEEISRNRDLLERLDLQFEISGKGHDFSQDLKFGKKESYLVKGEVLSGIRPPIMHHFSQEDLESMLLKRRDTALLNFLLMLSDQGLNEKAIAGMLDARVVRIAESGLDRCLFMGSLDPYYAALISSKYI